MLKLLNRPCHQFSVFIYFVAQVAAVTVRTNRTENAHEFNAKGYILPQLNMGGGKRTSSTLETQSLLQIFYFRKAHKGPFLVCSCFWDYLKNRLVRQKTM